MRRQERLLGQEVLGALGLFGVGIEQVVEFLRNHGDGHRGCWWWPPRPAIACSPDRRLLSERKSYRVGLKVGPT